MFFWWKTYRSDLDSNGVKTACLKKFEGKPIEKPLGDGGVQLFLSCPHCGTETPIASITHKGVKFRKKLQSLRGKRGQEKAFKKMLELYQAEVEKAYKA